MAKSRKRKPSFEPPEDQNGAGTGWVYRSDAVEDVAGASEPKSAPAPAPARRSTRAAKVEEAAAAMAVAPVATPPSSAPADRREVAQLIVSRYARYAAGAGLVPVPLVDLAAIGGVQVAMLGALAAQYDVPFSRERGKTIIAALVGGLMPSLAGHQVLKLVGPLVGILSVSGFAMASTQAVGTLFVSHFESGGTLQDLDVEQSRRHLLASLNRSGSPSAQTGART
jgi:uncharacterized protein (DUF697 family)